jgi:hypothetical protein
MIPQSNFQSLRSIIASLRVVIDQFDSDSKQARALILEIATRLDEGGLCERNHVSRTIKKILVYRLPKNGLRNAYLRNIRGNISKAN